MEIVNEIEYNIKNIFLSQYKDKIDENIAYDKYLSSFTKKQIERLLKINAIIEDDNHKLAHILSVSMHKKDIVVEELKNNIKEIYRNIFINIDEKMLIQIDMILKEYKNKTLELDITNLKYSLHFIEFLKSNCIAKINYIKSKNKIIIYIPDEIKIILTEILKDKKLKQKSKQNSIYINNIENLLSTYGVISFEDLKTIYNKVYSKIKHKDLLKIIKINAIFNDDINITNSDEDFLIYGIGFEDEDNLFEFYYSLPEELDYKIYTKKEYEEIREGIYHCDFCEYDKLFNFLDSHFRMNEKDMDYFDEMFVLDYIYSYQIDEKEAKRNLNNNLEKIFGKLNIIDKSFITKTILDIAKNYPNFNYKGHTYNEIKNK